MKKILLTTLHSKYIHSSLALAALTQATRPVCETHCIEFTINQPLQEIYRQILSVSADFLGISCYIWNIEPVLRLCEDLKKVCPHLCIILGGPEVSYRPELLKRCSFIDYIICGEGEKALPLLLTDLLQGRTPEQRFIRAPLCDLEDLPLVYEDLSGLGDLSDKIVYYETSRGCFYSCTYCLSSVERTIRYFPLERMRQEIPVLLRAGARQIKFTDRTFNALESRTLEILDFLKKIDNQKVNFHFEMTAQLLTEDIVKALEEARPGLFQVEIGMQSSHPQTLQAIQRPGLSESALEKIGRLQKSGKLHMHLDLICALPFESAQSFAASIDDAMRLKPDMLQIGFLKVLAGTKMQQDAERYAMEYRSYPPYEILQTPWMSAQEINLFKKAEVICDTIMNSGNFTLSFSRLQSLYPGAGCRLLLDLADSIERQGYVGAPGTNRLYEWLWDFYKDKGFADAAGFFDRLRFDFMKAGRQRKLPVFLRSSQDPLPKPLKEGFLAREEIQEALGRSGQHPLRMGKEVEVLAFEAGPLQKIKDGRLYLVAFDFASTRDFQSHIKSAGGLL